MRGAISRSTASRCDQASVLSPTTINAPEIHPRATNSATVSGYLRCRTRAPCSTTSSAAAGTPGSRYLAPMCTYGRATSPAPSQMSRGKALPTQIAPGSVSSSEPRRGTLWVGSGSPWMSRTTPTQAATKQMPNAAGTAYSTRLADPASLDNATPSYTTTLMAGEKSGNVDEVLTRYVHFQRMAMTFRKKLFVSLIYPTLLVSVVLIMVTFLFTYVVPKFADLFNSLDAKLPAITVFMLAVGQNAQKYAPFVFVGLVVLGFVLWRWKDTDRGADRIDRIVLSLPLLGDIRLKHQVASFSRMLSTLLQGGLPLVPAMETAGSSMSSRRILKGVMRAGTRVREGQGLAPSLEEQEIFPELAVEMIEVGESTGALPAMLNSVAEFYEEDVQTALGASMALIEPVILIIMAIFVGGVLISLYLPIFTLGVH